ncbi:uncharacterized protein PHALS_04669 [Plasmopara halstedii]|uniref:Uncharacterized protein n=1 Tax=Plasmopara halstedii TaxID=4781 RepID=A0A0P1A907_PLAHL|nr:uncharacterized protein PHALS_04669 [Plasmopara halstedii]CEG37226.1 hypothetical protein PHALS_04669 [Plasmopara halstedii]|eukprot:XP_024573595.1 hypothetical protein PHALS_04669 [Plasmopara halstedii]
MSSLSVVNLEGVDLFVVQVPETVIICLEAFENYKSALGISGGIKIQRLPKLPRLRFGPASDELVFKQGGRVQE